MTTIKLTLLMIFLIGCTSKNDANRALEASGFSDITITGYNFFVCSPDDIYHTGFTALNSKNQLVKGTVCSGLFKNATIRF